MGDQYISGKSLDQLVSDLLGTGQPGSAVHEQQKAAIQARITQIQQGTARDALRWAKVSAVAVAVNSTLALVALLVALF